MTDAGPAAVTELSFTRDLPRTTDCARLAREFLRDSFTGSPALDSLELIASELVTNAFTHGTESINLGIQVLNEKAVRLEVTSGFDPTLGEPTLDHSQPADTLSEGRRGLRIVSALVDSWGWEVSGSSVTVWTIVSS
ncbi:MAG: ATP-binding protein [Actinomycetia bacterium]|nr:ATP-binding protein [Actinomycetes bacterium]